MGGGDALLAEIDAGVRACKVRLFPFLICLGFCFQKSGCVITDC